jgi:hypothetical protein
MSREEYNGRTIEIYFSSAEQKQKIVAAAKKKGCPVSKYIASVLETLEHQKPATNSKDFLDLREKILQLEAANRALAKDLAAKDVELQRSKNMAHLANESQADYDQRLLDLIQSGPIHSAKIIESLFISPTDTQGLRAVTRQLEDLERAGFIAHGARGWRWLK